MHGDKNIHPIEEGSMNVLIHKVIPVQNENTLWRKSSKVKMQGTYILYNGRT